MARATIKDIARKLNLSPSTISRALRDHPDISNDTKAKVASLAKELDYYPDSHARSLKKGKSNTIGVIVPEIKHDFFSSVISGIEEIAYRSGYTIMVCQSNETYEREVVNTHALVSHRVAGLLVSISQNTKNGDHFRVLKRRNIPLVFFDRVCDDINTSKVIVDDHNGAYSAVEYLIKSGYKRIVHMAGPKNIPMSKNRLDGYLQALKDNNIPILNDLIIYGGLNEEDGVIGFHKIQNLKEKPDAIFAVNDPVAIGAFIHIKENNYKIPEDIALVGFSNNTISSLIDPPLTTVHQPSYDIGKTAAKILLEEIEDEEKKPRIEILKTKLIIRKST